MRKSTWGVWGLLLLLLLINGSVLLWLFSQPFVQARSMVDRFSKDGSLDTFSIGFYQIARLPLLGLGCLLILLAVLIVIYRWRVLVWIMYILGLPRLAWLDLRTLLADVRADHLSRLEWAGLVGLLLLAIAARVPFLMRPYYHDEAYTVVTFAIQPFHELIADYSMPNNHIFHTILVRLAYLIWGIQPWAMRLPAMVGGILCVPAIFFLARRLYNSSAALLSAAAVAALPVLVNFSTASRGYSLVMLFSILAFALADYVRKKDNLAAWTALIICLTLGLYTVPIFMASFAAVMLWLFLSMLVKDFGRDYTRQQFFGWLLATGVGVAFLTALLYMPVFLRSGLQTDFTKKFVEPIGWEVFRITMLSRMEGHAQELLTELPPVVGWLIAIGFGFSLLFALFPKHWSFFKPVTIPNQLAVLGGTLGLYTLLRVIPETRMVVFLVPFWLMWAAVGWVGLAQIFVGLNRKVNFPVVLNSLVIVIIVASTVWRLATHPEANYQYRGDVENAAIFLKAQVQETDLIVVNSPNDAAVWFYTRLYGINPDHYKRDLPFHRAYVLVDSGYDQTLESVILDRGPELFFFDFSTARVVFQRGSLKVMEVIPYENLIRSEYHLP